MVDLTFFEILFQQEENKNDDENSSFKRLSNTCPWGSDIHRIFVINAKLSYSK